MSQTGEDTFCLHIHTCTLLKIFSHPINLEVCTLHRFFSLILKKCIEIFNASSYLMLWSSVVLFFSLLFLSSVYNSDVQVKYGCWYRRHTTDVLCILKQACSVLHPVCAIELASLQLGGFICELQCCRSAGKPGSSEHMSESCCKREEKIMTWNWRCDRCAKVIFS